MRVHIRSAVSSGSVGSLDHSTFLSARKLATPGRSQQLLRGTYSDGTRGFTVNRSNTTSKKRSLQAVVLRLSSQPSPSPVFSFLRSEGMSWQLHAFAFPLWFPEASLFARIESVPGNGIHDYFHTRIYDWRPVLWPIGLEFPPAG
jgi:hypothetical protein